MSKAVFLDRDGVVNKEIGNYVWLWEQFEFNHGIFEALRSIQQKGYLLLIATNQGGIAKELYSHSDVNKLHAAMLERFTAENIKITDIYYCPHHHDYGKCLCRKPLSLMLEKGIAQYGIDNSVSYFIGDNERDEVAGKAAGLHSIRIKANSNLKDILKLIP